MNYLIQNASAIFTPHRDNATDIRISNGIIEHVGIGLPPEPDDVIINARGCVIYPGLVNTHHHLAQSLLKGVPGGLNQPLGEWLAEVPYRFWPRITPELMYHAARLGLYELLRSGATTCADHHYLYHARSSQEVEDAVWQAADEMGMRLVLCRGGATVQGSHRGMLKAGIEPEPLDLTLTRLDNSRNQYHQTDAMAMRRLVVAPTSLVHSSTPEHLRELARYARHHQLKMHSHLLEVTFDEEKTQQQYGMSAVDYADHCEWLGTDVWFAHLVQASAQDIQKLAASGTGIAHCPTSNCRLGSGVAPVTTMAQAGMTISIGVDGSASAESASLIQELNLTWLLHRAIHGPSATNPEQVLHWGSRAGARLLGLENVGEIVPGQAADLVLYDIDHPRFAGVHATLLAPLLCGEPVQIKHVFVQGRQVLEQGRFPNLDEAELTARVREGVSDLLRRTSS